ncbi:Ionotropic receptor 8a [Blattella germanica]|nr:Ionotropic receptor 8a [Blattella germanica]
MILRTALTVFVIFPPLLAQTSVKFLMLVEEQQKKVPNLYADGLSEAQKGNNDLALNEQTIYINREKEEETFKQVCNEIQKAVTVIVDLTWTGWSRIRVLSESTGIPYIRADATIGGFVQVIDAYLTERQSTDAALIFQNEEELDQALYYLIGNSIIRVIVLDQLPGNSTEKLLAMRPVPSYFVIFANTENVIKLFKKAQDGKLVTRSERWNLVFTDFKYAEFQESSLDILTSLLTLQKDVCCRLSGLEKGCNCPDDFEILPAYLKEVMLFLSDLLMEMKRSGSDLSIPVSDLGECQNLDAKQADNSTRDKFYETMQQVLNQHTALGFNQSRWLLYYRNDMDIVVANSSQRDKVATWTMEDGLMVKPNLTLAPTRRFFRVGTAEAVPWSYRKLNPTTKEVMKDDKGNEMWEGYCIDLLQRLSVLMEFDYEIVPPANGGFGTRSPDGTWDGMVGDLAMGETDMVIAPLTMTSEREEVIDFVAPYFDQSGISIVIRKPVRKTSLFKFMTVLRLEVWLSIVGALTVTGIMIWILDKYSPYSAQNNKGLYPYPCREFTLKESFWFALTSFTPQGGGEAPKALSGRTLVAAYWLFVVLMLATFTANLAAFLTVERMKSPVASLEQLARQSRINYTVVNNSDTHEYFKNMKNAEDVLYNVWKDITLNSSSDQSKYRVWDYPIKEQYGHILQAITQTGPVENATIGFQKVIDQEEGKFAFIHDAAQIRYEVSRNCNLTEVGEMFAEQPYAIAVQQGSHLQEEISRKILDLQKDRYFETLSGKYWNSSAKGDCPNNDDSEGITLESLGGVFIATLFGLALAMITLAGEIFYYKRKKMTMVSAPKPVNEPPKKQITIGKEFRPVMEKTMPRVSYISVFPRNQLY